MSGSRNRGKAMSRAELARLWSDRRLSRDEIGRRLGISAQGVQWRAKRLGLPPRPDGPVPRFDRDDPLFVEMWVANVRPSEMGRHFGVTLGTITHNARRLGLRRACTRHNSIGLTEFAEMKLARSMAGCAAAEQRAMRVLGVLPDASGMVERLRQAVAARDVEAGTCR